MMSRVRITPQRKDAPAESPAFAALTKRQWQSTALDLTVAGQWNVLTTIRIIPWLLIVAVITYLVSLTARFVIWLRTKQPAIQRLDRWLIAQQRNFRKD